MIVTPRFVFLHLHKSGGTFVNECIFKFVADALHVGYHLPKSLIPDEFTGLPVLGFVRNPWAYYVSWYNFQSGRPNPNFLFRILSDDGRLGFEPAVRNMLNLGAGSVRLELVLRALPSTYSNQGLNLPRFALEAIRGTNLGFYSFLYNYLYGGGPPPVIVGTRGNPARRPSADVRQGFPARERGHAHLHRQGGCAQYVPAWRLPGLLFP